MQYGQNRPYICSIDSTGRRTLEKISPGLRREDHEHFDRLFVRVRYYTQAATYQCHDNPMEAILLSIALDQEKRLNAVEKVLQNAGVLCEIAARMDSRSLPEPARDDVMAHRPEPVTLPFDR